MCTSDFNFRLPALLMAPDPLPPSPGPWARTDLRAGSRTERPSGTRTAPWGKCRFSTTRPTPPTTARPSPVSWTTRASNARTSRWTRTWPPLTSTSSSSLLRQTSLSHSTTWSLGTARRSWSASAPTQGPPRCSGPCTTRVRWWRAPSPSIRGTPPTCCRTGPMTACSPRGSPSPRWWKPTPGATTSWASPTSSEPPSTPSHSPLETGPPQVRSLHFYSRVLSIFSLLSLFNVCTFVHIHNWNWKWYFIEFLAKLFAAKFRDADLHWAHNKPSWKFHWIPPSWVSDACLARWIIRFYSRN